MLLFLGRPCICLREGLIPSTKLSPCCQVPLDVGNEFVQSLVSFISLAAVCLSGGM